MSIVTITYVKDTAFFTNYDEGNIKQAYIDIVEDNTIKPILGKDLYNAVSGGSPSAIEITLRDTYVKPLIAYSVKSMALAETGPLVSNTGASFTNTNNSTVTSEAIEDAHRSNEALTLQLRQRLIEYLRDNAAAYNWTELDDSDFLTKNIFVP